MRLSLNEISDILYNERPLYNWEVVMEDNGYSLPEYSPKFGEYGTILAQYKKFMLRHSDWYNSNLFYHFNSGNGKLIKYGHSYMGYYDFILGKTRSYIKVMSHFMPYTLRDGMEMIEELRDSKDLIIFAVTPYLGRMLDKLGFYRYGEIPQMFAGNIITKVVYTNRELDTRELKLFSISL